MGQETNPSPQDEMVGDKLKAFIQPERTIQKNHPNKSRWDQKWMRLFNILTKSPDGDQ